MVEREPYTGKMTRDEAVFLMYFIQRTETAALKRSHQGLVTKVAYIAESNELIQNSDAT